MIMCWPRLMVSRSRSRRKAPHQLSLEQPSPLLASRCWGCLSRSPSTRPPQRPRMHCHGSVPPRARCRKMDSARWPSGCDPGWQRRRAARMEQSWRAPPSSRTSRCWRCSCSSRTAAALRGAYPPRCAPMCFSSRRSTQLRTRWYVSSPHSSFAFRLVWCVPRN
jgi:hypothetical protein